MRVRPFVTASILALLVTAGHAQPPQPGRGGFVGGNLASLDQPAALGFAAGATDTGHEGGSGSFALDAGGRLNW